MKLARIFESVGGRFADLLLPRQCAACVAPIDEGDLRLCSACAWELSGLVSGAYCRTCGSDRGPHLRIDGLCTDCRLKKPGLRFAAFSRVGRYGGCLRRVLLQFKRDPTLDVFLGELLARSILARIDPHQVDLWVPIPSHWRRRLGRGYQPTHLLTRTAVRHWNGRAAAALALTRYVPPLHHGMSAAERSRAVAGAFRAARDVGVEDLRICLIDDVTNTGATLGEAARTLIAAGARSVSAAVIATVPRWPVIAGS